MLTKMLVNLFVLSVSLFSSMASAASMMSVQEVREFEYHGHDGMFHIHHLFPEVIKAEEMDPFAMLDFIIGKDDSTSVVNEALIGRQPFNNRDLDISYIRDGVRGYYRHVPAKKRVRKGVIVNDNKKKGHDIYTYEGVSQGFQVLVHAPLDRVQIPRGSTFPLTAEDLIDEDTGNGVIARIVAGRAFGSSGSFSPIYPVQVVEFDMAINSNVTFQVPAHLNTAFLIVFEGNLVNLNDQPFSMNPHKGAVVLLDANSTEKRNIHLASSGAGCKVMLMAGKKVRDEESMKAAAVHQKQIEKEDRQNDRKHSTSLRGTMLNTLMVLDQKLAARRRRLEIALEEHQINLLELEPLKLVKEQ